MRPTEQLKAEHEGIQLMLKILGKVCVELEAKHEPDPQHIAQILDFLKVFADKCHHGKEEDLLFPELEKAGVPKEAGPIAVMLAEHTLGRSYIKGMASAMDEYNKGSCQALARFIENARNYINLLTQHIDKENNILFPMADMHLSKDKQEELSEHFERLEIERIGIGRHEEFHKLLHSLKERYL